jgi:hypothetical protein
MSPLPAGFLSGVAGLTTVEQLWAYAISQINGAGANSGVFVDETTNQSTRAIQIFPVSATSAVAEWALITRLSLLLPNNWAGSPNRLWTLVSVVGASTTIPAGWTFPAGLALTNWERVAAWAALALQATFSDSLAAEASGTGTRAASAVVYPVEFTAIKSTRLIARLSQPLAANWATGNIWSAVLAYGATAINAAFL